MIKANELRIGNWVFHPIGKEFKVGPENIQAVFDKSDCEETLGIPLTEDWLLKCGATKHIINNKDVCYMNTDNRPNFIAKPNGNSFIFRINKNLQSTNTCEIELSYVHELQNIYFLIKGEELEFKN
jgi:hypothetical protein